MLEVIFLVLSAVVVVAGGLVTLVLAAAMAAIAWVIATALAGPAAGNLAVFCTVSLQALTLLLWGWWL